MEGKLRASSQGEGRGGPDVRAGAPETVAEAAIACELQKAQLSSRPSDHAVDAIVENLGVS